MMNIHTDHIKSNVLKLLKGTPTCHCSSSAEQLTYLSYADEPITTNPLWAIYQNAADELKPKRYEDLLDLKKIR